VHPGKQCVPFFYLHMGSGRKIKSDGFTALEELHSSLAT
jgi:hypothetical protein